MWKKVIPVAAVLILAWIGLNLMTAKDAEESVAHVPDAATSEVAESAGGEAEAVNLAENATADPTPETAPADEEPAEGASADEAPAADTASSDATADDETAADATTDAETAVEATADTSAAETPTEGAEPEAEVAETTEAAEVAAPDDETSEVAAADGTETETPADASGSTVAMRYPTDPVTGASIYDQGMVEVVIEPTVEPVEEEAETASEQNTEATESATEEVAATEPEEVVEPVTVTKVEMRYPTDPNTGATIYDQGMVEVEFESVVEPGEEVAAAATDLATDSASDASDAVATKSNTQMRYPTDPVTGASLYDQGMVEVEIESENDVEEVAEDAVDQATETAESSEGAVEKSKVQMRYPTDPVTGATIYDQGMVEVEIESDSEVEEVEESAAEQATESSESAEAKGKVQMRYPTDPVTGATIYDQGMVEVEIESDSEVEEVAESAAEQATETSESAEVKGKVQMRYPTDPVTGASLYDQGMVEVATETSEDEVADAETESSSADASEAATAEAPAETAPDTATEDSATAEVVTEVEVTESDAAGTAAPTREVAAIAERGTFSLSAISRSLGSVFGTTTTVLSTARDEASAQKVLPRLEAASSSLTDVADQYATLPEYAKGPLGKVIKRGMSRLKPMADTALTREGVGPVLMPVMGPMLETMQSMLR